MSGTDRGLQSRLLKSAGAMTAMTLLSRVLGLVRELVRSHLLGTGMGADAFGVAAMMPNLLRRLFAEGAATAAFVPVFTETMKREERPALWRFASEFLSFLTLLVTAVTILGIVLAPFIVDLFFAERFREVEGKVALTVVLTQLMFPYLALISTAAIFQGILNSFRVFAPSAFTPVLLNLAIIAAASSLAWLFPDPSYAFASGFLFGGLLQLLFQIPFALRLGARIRPTLRCWTPRVREVLRIMGPGVLAAGVYQINVFISQTIASRLHEGSISSLQYSVRLQELVLGVFVVSIATVILPTLSGQVAEGDQDAAKGTLRFSLGLLALVTLPATAGLILLGPPIVRVLFQHGEFDALSTDMTSFALIFHAIGIYPIAVGRVVQQAFFAMKDQRTPMRVGALSMVVNVVFCFALPPLFAETMAHGGVAAAGALAALANAVVLIALLRPRLGQLGLTAMAVSLGRIALASIAMAAAMWGAALLLDMSSPQGRLLLVAKIAASGLLGVGVFLAAAFVLRSPELRELKSIVFRKLGR